MFSPVYKPVKSKLTWRSKDLIYVKLDLKLTYVRPVFQQLSSGTELQTAIENGKEGERTYNGKGKAWEGGMEINRIGTQSLGDGNGVRNEKRRRGRRYGCMMKVAILLYLFIYLTETQIVVMADRVKIQ
jgi:hypothetical protein